MSTDLEHVDSATLATLGLIERAIASAGTVEDALDVKARIAAAKAQAQAYKIIKRHRLDLLRLEVAALVRVIDLGGADLLSPDEAAAGAWWAAMTPAAREAAILGHGRRTTATGIHVAATDERERAQVERENEAAGRNFARGQLADVIEATANRFGSTSFEVADLVDVLVRSDQIDTGDEGFRRGVAEVCRHHLQSQTVELLDGTVIPRFLTVRKVYGDRERWARIPAHAATYADLLADIGMREQQIADAQAKVERLRDFARRLEDCGAAPARQIGDIIAESLT